MNGIKRTRLPPPRPHIKIKMGGGEREKENKACAPDGHGIILTVRSARWNTLATPFKTLSTMRIDMLLIAAIPSLTSSPQFTDVPVITLYPQADPPPPFPGLFFWSLDAAPRLGLHQAGLLFRRKSLCRAEPRGLRPGLPQRGPGQVQFIHVQGPYERRASGQLWSVHVLRQGEIRRSPTMFLGKPTVCPHKRPFASGGGGGG